MVFEGEAAIGIARLGSCSVQMLGSTSLQGPGVDMGRAVTDTDVYLG
jgi:hypothetical protein